MSRSEYRDAAEKTKALARRENNKRRRILVVEDDQISLALLKQLLEVHGYEILETPGGLEAIDIARNEQPDLILMDIRLPDMCGLEVTRLLKQDEQTKAIPIIAVTALATPEYEKKGLESGCDAYIAKPITLGNLLRTIASFLSSVPSAVGSLNIDRFPMSNDRYQVATGLEGSAHDAQRGIK
jgi:two-component system, cell cycle response regulator DivK